MSEHAKKAMLEDIQQQLIETMADFLDDENIVLSQAIALVKDPIDREESELHIRMANAAFEEYKRTIVAS
jgi:cob(I)alamin adenosyltransferase